MPPGPREVAGKGPCSSKQPYGGTTKQERERTLVKENIVESDDQELVLTLPSGFGCWREDKRALRFLVVGRAGGKGVNGGTIQELTTRERPSNPFRKGVFNLGQGGS